MNSRGLPSTSRRLPLLAAGCILVAAPRALAVPCEGTFADTLGCAWSSTANWSTGQVPTVMQNVKAPAPAAAFQLSLGETTSLTVPLAAAGR